MSSLETFAKRYRARILRDPFPKGVSLEQGLKSEIDAASRIYFRMKDVHPDTVSYDIEYQYINSKWELFKKTRFYYNE